MQLADAKSTFVEKMKAVRENNVDANVGVNKTMLDTMQKKEKEIVIIGLQNQIDRAETLLKGNAPMSGEDKSTLNYYVNNGRAAITNGDVGQMAACSGDLVMKNYEVSEKVKNAPKEGTGGIPGLKTPEAQAQTLGDVGRQAGEDVLAKKRALQEATDAAGK